MSRVKVLTFKQKLQDFRDRLKLEIKETDGMKYYRYLQEYDNLDVRQSTAAEVEAIDNLIEDIEKLLK